MLLRLAFQAGYPKTPVFNGSRLAEVFLFLAGSTFRPVAYKVGLALLCLLVPWLLILASRGMGLDWTTSVLATAIGLVVWWSPTSYNALEAGSSELLVGALAVLANLGFLIRFHRFPGILSWLGLVLTAWLGWFSQPMLFPHCPASFSDFLSSRRPSPWHPNLAHRPSDGRSPVTGPEHSWLVDWVTYWWLRSPEPIGGGILSHRTWYTLWNAPLLGRPGLSDPGAISAGQCPGWGDDHAAKQRTTARLLATGTGGLFLLALLGISWEPLGNLGTAGLLSPALWFASLPAAQAWVQSFRFLSKLVGSGLRAGLITIVLGMIIAGLAFETISVLGERLQGVPPLLYELGPQRKALIDAINTYTNPDARILWEDLPLLRTSPHWTPLLPLLTNRSFVGGLDPDATIEHATIGFVDQNLARQHISQWTDEALEEYCTQYNIGWVICFSPSAIKRFSDWSGAEKIKEVTDETTGYLFFTIPRTPNFALKGQARLIHADSHHITVGDIVPENGVVVLSLHYQAGMRVSPSRVHIEREPSALDPIGFLRLRVAGPVSRVTFTWGER